MKKIFPLMTLCLSASFLSSVIADDSTFPKSKNLPADIVYAPKMPDDANAKITQNLFTLSNNTIGMSWSLNNGVMKLIEISDFLHTQVFNQNNELFCLKIDQQMISSDQCVLIQEPKISDLKGNFNVARWGERLDGKMISAQFKHEATGCVISWKAELRNGSHYIKMTLKIEKDGGQLNFVRSLSANIGAARQIGSASAGNPLCSQHFFAGLELPMSQNRMDSANSPSQWVPSDMQAKSFTRLISDLNSGNLKVTFNYQKGPHRIDVKKVSLVSNGKTISEDEHNGFSGHSKQNNEYTLTIPEGVRDGELHVILGGPENDTQSFGKMVLSQGVFAQEKGGNSLCELPCKLPLVAQKPYDFSTVVGVYPKNQLRRAFLRYVERERATPYRPYLHYNGWFDFDRNVTQNGMLQIIDAYNNELIKKRGVPVKAFVIDDGWDDWDAGFWEVNRRKFPDQFTTVGKKLDSVSSRFGIWISPLAGYDHSGTRINHAARTGLTPNGEKRLDLSYQPYYDWFLKKTSDFVTKDKVAFFKFDKAGNGVNPHFLALLNICRTLHNIDPELFINITVGTWPSPFWLNHIDCTWRGGNDMGYEGPGNDREKWITYRDAQTYRGIVSVNSLYPLNSIMNHGICLSNGSHSFPKRAFKATTDIQNEVRSYFGSGTCLQELYVMPSVTPQKAWDDIAECAKWANANTDILVDTHWIGGNPSGGKEVYGWASWAMRKGIITLRNPTDSVQSFTIDIQKQFELPEIAAKKYSVTSPFLDTIVPFREISADQPISIKLQPFDVLVLEFTPIR